MAYDGSEQPVTVREIISAKLGIRATCRCGHAKTLDPARVCLSPTTEIADVGELLRCSKCGTRGMTSLVAPLH